MPRNRKIVWSLVLVGVVFLAFSLPYLVACAEPSTKWTMTFEGTGDDEAYTYDELSNIATRGDKKYTYQFIGNDKK